MQEHIRRAHPEHYIPKLPATEESFILMINTTPSERPPPPASSSSSAPSGVLGPFMTPSDPLATRIDKPKGMEVTSSPITGTTLSILPAIAARTSIDGAHS